MFRASITTHSASGAISTSWRPVLACAQFSTLMAPGSLKRVASTDRDISPPAKRKATPTATTTTVTNKAVANFFTPASQKEPEKVSFQIIHDSLLIARYENATASRSKSGPLKIAAFDFDDTLIATKSGLKFARGEDDWRWWHPSVPGRLKELQSQGYSIVIISNQAAVSLRSDSKTPKHGMKSLSNLKGKVCAVLKALDLPICVYAATEKDLYRKPRTGMWEQVLKDYGVGAESVDLEASLFVGDAGGRAEDKTKGRKKDHSCSDRDLAANIGINFQTPEEFFLGEEAKPFTRAFEPATYLDTELTSQTDATPVIFTKKNAKDLVLFCGSPGAGKSTFYWRHMQPLGYERVNQDILKSRDKCMKVATQVLGDEGKGVVVDNTNADIETRAAWIALARRLKVECRLVHFTASAKLCEHNDAVRALTGDLVSRQCLFVSLRG